MPRLHLSLPHSIQFCTQITVQIGDINYGNHLANDAVLRLLHESRLRWLTSGQFSELDCAGVGLIMADAAIQYKAQAFYGETLEFALGISEISRVGFTIQTAITRQHDGVLIAIAQNGMVCFDYATQKVANIPNAFKQFLQNAV